MSVTCQQTNLKMKNSYKRCKSTNINSRLRRQIIFIKSHMYLFVSILKNSELFPGSRVYSNLALTPSSASSAFKKR